MNEIGVLGATSLVGECLLRLMSQSKVKVTAFSRQTPIREDAYVQWRQLNPIQLPENEGVIPNWICVSPIWVLPDYFEQLEASGAQRVVVLSSTSRFTKDNSSDPAEQVVAGRLADGEARFKTWTESKGIDWIILRPTMIFGLGKDKNISEIARFICRWNFFPLLGEGNGLRQPIHADDVAKACYTAITSQAIKNRDYNLSGGETLPYREMVKQIFMALDKKPRFIRLPRWCFHLGLSLLRFFPRFRHWSVAMAYRMDKDLVFEHEDAAADLGFSPRPFQLEMRDLP